MKLLITSLVLMLAMALVPSPALAANTTHAFIPDKDFLLEASNWAYTGTWFDDLADKQASDARVKEMARRAAREHKQMIANLTTLAVNMAQEIAPQVPREQQVQMDMLAALSGADFDRAYVKLLVKIQEKLVSLFEAKAADAENQDLKTYSRKALPALKVQLKAAKALAEKLQLDR
jgi:putative membrane protein